MEVFSDSVAPVSPVDDGVSALPPAEYFPFSAGKYIVSPGIMRLGRDGGNGARDGQFFQLDREFPSYRETKLAARHDAFGRHVCGHRLSDKVRAEVVKFLLERLPLEHPGHFRSESEGDETKLTCHLTGETLWFGAAGGLIDTTADVKPNYADALDALACQLQEDIAIVSADGDGHWLSYLHLCFPNHWAAAEKIGRRFTEIHQPVAEIDAINRQADSYVKMMIGATDGLVRFAWGLATSDELNQHPECQAENTSRTFDPEHPQAFVRIERQTMRGFPQVDAALFTIRTYFLDCAELAADNPEACDALVNAVETMSAAAAQYKGVASWRKPWAIWMRGLLNGKRSTRVIPR